MKNILMTVGAAALMAEVDEVWTMIGKRPV